MKKTPIIQIQPMKNIWVQDRRTDTDRDGVPNYRDCVWYDSRRQDWKPSPSDIEGTNALLNKMKLGGFWVTAFGTFQRTGQKELTLLRKLGNEEDINRVKKVLKAIGWKFVDGTRLGW